jgi:hypothetical protein
MPARGKSSGYKGWVRVNAKEYELYLSKFGKKIGYAKIHNDANKWFVDVQTDLRGLHIEGTRSPPHTTFKSALAWLNKERKYISRKLFGRG